MPKQHDKHPPSALIVQQGIEAPQPFDAESSDRFRKSVNPELPAAVYIEGIRASDRTLLSKAITLVESTLPRHQALAQQIVTGCLPLSGHSVRIGVTGVPGVGKSTFLNSLGKQLVGLGHRVAVLAIDPSSQRSKGSILGDKTRMEDLANDPAAFVRPSASAGTLGGVARKTRETIVLCEASGFDIIFVETVGVGQSETAVHSMVDFFLLLMLAGAGDELQGIKRGIMEMADAIVINKADGDNVRKAELAMRQYQNALHLFPPQASGWIPRVTTCSSTEQNGIGGVWEMIGEYLELARPSGYFESRRKEQAVQTLRSTIEETLRLQFYADPVVRSQYESLAKDIAEGRTSPYLAARQLLENYRAGK